MAGESLDQQAVGEKIHAGPAVLLGQGGAHEALAGGPLQKRDRRLFGPVIMLGQRRDFLFGEVAKQVAKHLLFFGEGEIHKSPCLAYKGAYTGVWRPQRSNRSRGGHIGVWRPLLIRRSRRGGRMAAVAPALQLAQLS